MKKIKLSIVEKRLIRCIFVFILIQVLIVLLFLRLFGNGQPVKIEETKQADIIVEDIYLVSFPKEHWLVIVSDSGRYKFDNHPMFDKYSLEELKELISKGDKLELKYSEKYNIFGKVNLIADMRSETEIYRTIEENNLAFQGVPTIVVILFSIIELIFVGVVLLYCWLDQNIIKGLYRKIKKRFLRKQKTK